MNARANQFGNLTGTERRQYFPEEDKVLSVADSEFKLISLEDAKIFLRVKTSADDVYIERLILGVTYQIERYIAKDTQPTVRLAYWSRPNPVVRLPVEPVTEIVSVKEVTSSGNEVDVPAENYQIFGIEHLAIRFHVLPYTLKVQYNSGYEKAPEAIKTALMQEIALQYKNRQDPSQPESPATGGLSVEARHALISSGLYDYSR